MLTSRNIARRAAAFTLVELLVVIGIIALLISILLPALSKARESGNQVKCLAQNRQILQGMMLHANDHRNYMPIAGNMFTPSGSPADMGDPLRQKYEYYGTNNNYVITSTPAGVGKYLSQDMDFTSLASIEKSMQTGLTRNIFVCPSDKTGGRYGKTVNSASGSGGSHWTSYAFNEAALGWADPPSITGFRRLRGHVTSFRHPGQLMLLADAAPRSGSLATEDANAWMLFNANVVDATMGDWYRKFANKGTRPDGTPTKDAADRLLADPYRHRGRVMVGFADGHAENMLFSEDLDKVSISVDFGGISP